MEEERRRTIREEFEAWLAENDIQHPKLSFQNLPGFGLSFVAAKEIEENEEIGTIPFHAVLSVEAALASEAVGRPVMSLVQRGRLLFSTTPSGPFSILSSSSATSPSSASGEEAPTISRRTLFRLFLIAERFHKELGSSSSSSASSSSAEGEEQKPKDGFWRAYLRSLPQKYQDPFWWTEEEVNMLRGFNLHAAVVERKRLLRNTFEGVMTALSDAYPEMFPPHIFTWENFLWANSVCSSRAFPRQIALPSLFTSLSDRTFLSSSSSPSLQQQKDKEKVTEQEQAQEEGNTLKRKRTTSATSPASLDNTKKLKSSSSKPKTTKNAEKPEIQMLQNRSIEEIFQVMSQEEESDECLLPMLDIGNHKNGQRISWIKDLQQQRLSFVFGGPGKVPPGTQVFNNYGPKGDEELILGYGFCIPDNTNNTAAVLIGLPSLPSSVSSNEEEEGIADDLRWIVWKREMIERRGLSLRHYLNLHQLPSDLLSVLRIFAMTEREHYFYEEKEEDKKEKEDKDEDAEYCFPFLNDRNELDALNTLKVLIESKLLQMETAVVSSAPSEQHPSDEEKESELINMAVFRSRAGLQADKQLLDSGKYATEHQRLALCYRIGQREVLLRARELTIQRQQKVVASAKLHLSSLKGEHNPFAPSASSASFLSPLMSSKQQQAYRKWLLANNEAALCNIDFYAFEHSSQALTTQAVSSSMQMSPPLLKIPRALLITIRTVQQSESFCDVLSLVQGVEEEDILVLFLIHERAKGKRSLWFPFFSALPPFTTPLFWTNNDQEENKGEDEELAKLLGRRSQAYLDTLAKRQQLQEAFYGIVPALSGALPRLFPEEIFTWEAFLWANTLLETRSFQLNGQTIVVPLAWLPRHLYLPLYHQEIAFGTENNMWMVVTSLAEMEKREEFFWSFDGGKSSNNSELLVKYGVLSSQIFNSSFETIKFDIDPICLKERKTQQQTGAEEQEKEEDDESCICAAHMMLLSRMNLGWTHYIDGNGKLCNKLLDSLRVCFMDDDEAISFLQHLQGEEEEDKSAEEMRFMLPKKQDAVIMQFLRETLEEMLQDLAEIDGEVQQSSNNRAIEQLAKTYRAGQRDIISRSLATLSP